MYYFVTILLHFHRNNGSGAGRGSFAKSEAAGLIGTSITEVIRIEFLFYFSKQSHEAHPRPVSLVS